MDTWVPLESNPEMLNIYMKSMGVSDNKVFFVDVLGLSDDLLSMVPTPVHAFLVVFPINKKTEKLSSKLSKTHEATLDFLKKNNVIFIKQYVPNACGTVAIIHALANNINVLGNVDPESPIFKFLQSDSSLLSENMSEEEKQKVRAEKMGNILKDNQSIQNIHESCATAEGSTEIELDVLLHFSCFVSIGGRCVELDGRQENIILHGETPTNADFVKAAADAIQKKMDVCPNCMEFGITALVSKPEDW